MTTTPGTKPGTATKSVTKKTKETAKLKDMDKINPFQRPTKNMSRAGDIRKQRDAYGQVIVEEQAQKARELQELKDKITYFKRDNEKLLRQQTTKFGLTFDNMKVVKEELEQARLTNDSLFHEVESRKEECDKLQHIMDNVIKHINEHMLENSDLNREKREYEQDLEQVARNEIKIHALVQSNKDMRNLLLKHKINPSTDAAKMAVKTKSPRGEVSHKNNNTNNTSLPMLYNRHNLLSFRNDAEKRAVQKRQPKGILRRTKSNNPTTNYVSAREFFKRRGSDPWARAVEVYI